MTAGLLWRANAIRHQTGKSATATAVCQRSCNLFRGRQERTLSNADDLLSAKTASRIQLDKKVRISPAPILIFLLESKRFYGSDTHPHSATYRC